MKDWKLRSRCRAYPRVFNPVSDQHFVQRLWFQEDDAFYSNGTYDTDDGSVLLYPFSLWYTRFTIDNFQKLTIDRVTKGWSR